MIRLFLIGLLAATLVAAPAVAQDVTPLPLPTLAHVRESIGLTPQALYARYGRPAKVEEPGVPGFGLLGDKGITVIQYYDVDGGGRVAFLFSGHYQVAGVAFDNLRSTRYLSLSAFFSSVPRTVLFQSCIQSDAYHSLPGDVYSVGAVPLDNFVETTTAKWKTSTGGLFFARYRLDGHQRHVYDAVIGKERTMPPRDLGSLKLLQFAWLPNAGHNVITDANPDSHTDFSTLTFPNPDTPCYSRTGVPI